MSKPKNYMNMGYVVVAETTQDILMDNVKIPFPATIVIGEEESGMWESINEANDYLNKVSGINSLENCRVEPMDEADPVDLMIATKDMQEGKYVGNPNAYGNEVDIMQNESWASDVWVHLK